jgi:hypothetical protein
MMTTQTTVKEALGHGVSREWLEDGRILVLTMPEGAHRDAIDVWFNTLTETADQWDKSRPFLVLHDSRELGFSYYFRERAIAAGKRTPKDLKGRAAVVLSGGVIGHLLAMLAKLSSNNVSAHFTLKTFNDYDQALTWLREGL